MFRQKPIIVIDDDEDDCEFVISAVQALGLTNKVICFSSGADAIDFLTETNEAPRIIFCDINMPLLNGIQVRERINSNEQLRKKSTPFVFLSTAVDSKLIEQAYSLTVQGFFQKPNSLEVLKKMLSKIFDYWNESYHPNK